MNGGCAPQFPGSASIPGASSSTSPHDNVLPSSSRDVDVSCVNNGEVASSSATSTLSTSKAVTASTTNATFTKPQTAMRPKRQKTAAEIEKKNRELVAKRDQVLKKIRLLEEREIGDDDDVEEKLNKEYDMLITSARALEAKLVERHVVVGADASYTKPHACKYPVVVRGSGSALLDQRLTHRVTLIRASVINDGDDKKKRYRRLHGGMPLNDLRDVVNEVAKESNGDLPTKEAKPAEFDKLLVTVSSCVSEAIKRATKMEMDERLGVYANPYGEEEEEDGEMARAFFASVVKKERLEEAEQGNGTVGGGGGEADSDVICVDGLEDLDIKPLLYEDVIMEIDRLAPEDGKTAEEAAEEAAGEDCSFGDEDDEEDEDDLEIVEQVEGDGRLLIVKEEEGEGGEGGDGEDGSGEDIGPSVSVYGATASTAPHSTLSRSLLTATPAPTERAVVIEDDDDDIEIVFEGPAPVPLPLPPASALPPPVVDGLGLVTMANQMYSLAPPPPYRPDENEEYEANRYVINRSKDQYVANWLNSSSVSPQLVETIELSDDEEQARKETEQTLPTLEDVKTEKRRASEELDDTPTAAKIARMN